jgi:hypothetical protein
MQNAIPQHYFLSRTITDAIQKLHVECIRQRIPIGPLKTCMHDLDSSEHMISCAWSDVVLAKPSVFPSICKNKK